VFDDPNLKGDIMVTVNLKEVMSGTDVSIIQAGVPDVIPMEMCHLGWQDSLKQLAQFVELGTPIKGG
jgi:Activator of Hsp90 ATPase homolog 1-like protein